MKLLLFTHAFVSARNVRFDVENPSRVPVHARREGRSTRLRCVWSRGPDGRLTCRWLRDDSEEDDVIPVAAIRRFPMPSSLRKT